ncbi:uncharacterized protein LOC110020348 [Phalaenopsis equestris]|uniref:uncharacterized protein LOC110020348 n=1 Tax=Phalaenopsis equestris TaxID=78828 RepID=UPI0009E3435B|nr:uncharacterized protein LOC110020348 [Phalaenopsis equestris]
MTQIPEISEKSGDPIKIGTVGTIGSLMSQELDSMNSAQAASSSQNKNLTTPPCLPCVDTSSTQPSKIQSNEASSSNNHNAHPHHLSNSQKLNKQKPLKNGQRAPILTNEAIPDKKTRRNRPSTKGRRTYIVEVVDIKCGNPMSSRLKKFGFTKLSETIG